MAIIGETTLILEDRTFLQGSTATYTTTLTSDGSTPVAAASVNSLTMSLIDRRTRAVINSREDQNILNTNNVTLHATSGLLTWEIQEEDTAIVNTTDPVQFQKDELHFAIFTVLFDTSTRTAKHILPMQIRRELTVAS